MNWLTDIDHSVLQFINNGLSNAFFDMIMPWITSQKTWQFPLLLVWLWLVLFGEKRGRIAAALLLITLILTDACASQIIKPLVGRLRPSHTLADSIHVLVSKGGKYGFVSNHAANVFAGATVMGYFYPRWKAWLYGLATLVAFSRVYVGVHYPADVFFGGLFGYGLAWVILTAWVILKMREMKRGRTWVWYN